MEAQYEKRATQGFELGDYHVVEEFFVRASPKECYDIWITDGWFGESNAFPFPFDIIAGKCQVLERGKPSGLGSIRRMASWRMPWVIEECLDCEPGKFFRYSAKNDWTCLLPLKYHMGSLRFYDAGPNCTRIVWECATIGYFGFGWFIWLLFRIMYSWFSGSYARAVQRKTKQAVDWSPFKRLAFVLIFYALLVTGMKLSNIVNGKVQHPAPAYLEKLDQYYQATNSNLTAYVKQTSFAVIGGTGFTGSAIVHELRQRKAKRIVVFGRSMPPLYQYPYRESEFYPLAGVEYISVDIGNAKNLEVALKGIDVVFHPAVYTGDPQYCEHCNYPEKFDEINIRGMQNVIEASKLAKVKQIIYTSSVDTVFHSRPSKFINETIPYAAYGYSNQSYAVGPFAVGDHYARTKIIAEDMLLKANGTGGLVTLALRPAGIYGPGENANFPKATAPAILMGLWPFYYHLDDFMDWSCVGNLAAVHILSSYQLKHKPAEAGGLAYFVTDDDKDRGAGQYKVFEPVIRQMGVSVFPYVWLPAELIVFMGWQWELFTNWLFKNSGIYFPPFVGRKEALKATVSHTHDNSRAQKILGKHDIFTSEECLQYTGEEMARRFKLESKSRPKYSII